VNQTFEEIKKKLFSRRCSVLYVGKIKHVMKEKFVFVIHQQNPGWKAQSRLNNKIISPFSIK